MTDVLAVAPHPDDMELAAGGTLALLADKGRRVVLVDLTRGERSTRGSAESRKAEARAAAAVLRASGRECLKLPDGDLASRDPDQLRAVIETLRNHRPRLVLTMHGNDDHPDHVEGAELVKRAAYLAGLRNYPEPDSEPFRPRRLLFAMGRRAFEPSVVVDVTAHYDTKREAIRAYATQFTREAGDPLVTPISDPGFLDRLEARDRYYGGMVGADYGEPFYHEGPIGFTTIDGVLGDV